LAGLSDRSATKATRSQYLRHAQQALAKVPVGAQPEALSLEVVVRMRLFSHGDSELEKAECLEWLVGLNGDEGRMDQLNARGKSLCYIVVGMALISYSSSHYATRTAAPIEQLQRGARLCTHSLLTANSNWAEYTGFLKFYACGMFSLTLTKISISYVAPDVTNDRAIVSRVLGQGGEILEAWHAAYSFSDFHLRVRVY
jgi:hypothetical protein